jgi:hypothetical protein
MYDITRSVNGIVRYRSFWVISPRHGHVTDCNLEWFNVTLSARTWKFGLLRHGHGHGHDHGHEIVTVTSRWRWRWRWWILSPPWAPSSWSKVISSEYNTAHCTLHTAHCTALHTALHTAHCTLHCTALSALHCTAQWCTESYPDWNVQHFIVVSQT